LENLKFDVLMIGSGAAGLRAAIEARGMGLEVAVVSQGPPGKGSCTIFSGGVFAATRQGESLKKHLAQTAELILQGALRREESRGAHFRENFPAQDDENWRGQLQVRLAPQDELQWTYQVI